MLAESEQQLLHLHGRRIEYVGAYIQDAPSATEGEL
jgi:hypothetical protein